MKDVIFVLSLTALILLCSCGQKENLPPYTPSTAVSPTESAETTNTTTSIFFETTETTVSSDINTSLSSDINSSVSSNINTTETTVTTTAEIIKGVSKDNYNAEDIIKYFSENNAPDLGEYIIKSSQDDKYLGQKGYYTSKINFRIESVEYNKREPYDACIEVYKNIEDADNMYKYYRNMYRNKPIYAEYLFKKDRALIRMKFDVDASQEEEYENLLIDFFEKLNSIRCISCGEIIPDDSTYCKYCGTKQ